MFGYDQKKAGAGLSILMATPEKALVDFLYLNPQYRDPDDFTELRLDEDFMLDLLNPEKLLGHARRMEQNSLIKRIKTLTKIYGL
jgi:hypothetical protein